MTREIPRDVLLQVLQASCRSMRQSVRLSRREFLLATTAAIAATPALVVAASLQDGPELKMTGGVLQVRFRGNQWNIDPARFGERAKVEWRTDGTDFRLLLSRARYPGTNLERNVRARIFSDGAQWRIALESDATKHTLLGDQIEPPLLEDWMKGKASFDFLRKAPIKVGAVTISPTEGHLVCTVDASLRMRWRGRARIDLEIGSLQAFAGTLDASSGTHDVLSQALGSDESRPFTRLTFEDTARDVSNLNLARVAGTHRLSWDARELSLRLIAFDTVRARNGEALITLEAFGALKLHGPGLSGRGAKLLLDKAVLLTWASSPARQVQIAYKLQRTERNFLFEADGFALEVSGPADPVTLDIKMAVLARFESRVNLHAAHVPVRGASMASVDYEGLPMVIVLPDGGSARDCSAFASFNRRSLLNLPLENGTLHLRRSSDLFDLRFEFRNYRLECTGGKTTLFERWAYGVGCEAKPNPPTLIAVFWPQHVQEEVFTNQQDKSKGLRLIDTLRFPEDLARTAIAAPSRVAMQGVEPRERWQQGVELTIEQITDWEELTLAVNARALPANATLEQQLGAIHLDPQAKRTDAQHAIFSSLSSRPSADETALEPVTGLVVSPDASARFATPRTPPSMTGAVPLWSARLRLGKNSAVRALHARQTNFGFLSSTCPPTAQQELHEFFSTLSAQDRAELVVLMSAYAMPSLRRLLRDEDDAKNARFYDDPKGMIMRPDRPLGFLSVDTMPYEVPIPGGKPATLQLLQEGILVPRGYQEFDLTMSALKGTLRSRWEGEPPAPLASNPFFGSALNIEGYIHRTVRGRDALVQVAYKGFLFPLGHRAALINVSERPFSPARGNAEMLDPTAYLIQRQYIVTRKPEKTFPALGQTFQGREFPATRVEMMTVVTPEIVDVLHADQERLNLGPWIASPVGREPTCTAPGRPKAESIGRVFWPRTRPGQPAKDKDGTTNNYGHEVQFEYRLDGVQQPLRSALIFVDNTAAHHANTMQGLVRYYEALSTTQRMMCGDRVVPDQPVSGEKAQALLRLVVTGGVERRYAPALKSGETSFQTEYWVLGATGGVSAQNSGQTASESFAMDALMEGADQPPFYPRMHRGYIKMQSLERLLGRPQGLIEVGYANRYVVHAFETAANPSAIYLDVLAPDVDLDVSGQGDASGGVAKPNARLAAISRSLGMIGGRMLPPTAATASKALTLQPRFALVGRASGTNSSALRFDTSAAQAGNFDPAEFFGGALADAMLLGIIPLKDVIRVVPIGLAPKLREVTEYASDELDKVLPGIAGTIAAAIRSAIQAGNDAVKTMLGNTAGAAIVDPLQEFYPSLASRATRLQQLCARIIAMPPDELKRESGTLVGELVATGKDFVQAVEDVAKTPLPKGLAEYVLELRAATNELQRLSDPNKLRTDVVDQLYAFASGLVGDLVEQHLFGRKNDEGKDIGRAFDLAFGIDLSESEGIEAQRAKVMAEVLNDPQAAVDRLRNSIMQSSLPGLFVQAFSRFEAIRREARGFLAFARAEVTEEVIGLMAQGDANLKQVPVIREAARAFTTDVAQALECLDAAKALRNGGVANLLKQLKLEPKVQQSIVTLAYAYTSTVYEAQKEATKLKVDKFREKVAKKLEEIDKASATQRGVKEVQLRALENELSGWRRAFNLPKLKDLEAMVTRTIEAEFERQAKVLEDKARAAVEDALGKVATDVAAAVAATFDVGGQLIELVGRSANGALQAWCTGPGAAALADLQVVLLGTKEQIGEALAAAKALQLDLMQLDVPDTVPNEARTEAQAQVALARRLVQETIEQAERLATGLSEIPPNVCESPDLASKAIRTLDELCRARLRLLDNIISGMAAAARYQVLVQVMTAQSLSLFKAESTNLCGHIKAMLDAARSLIVPPQAKVKALGDRAVEIAPLLPRGKSDLLKALLKQLEIKPGEMTKAGEIDAELETVSKECQNTATALDGIARRIEAQRALVVGLIEGEERRLASFMLDLVLSRFVEAKDALAALGKSMLVVSGFVGSIVRLHTQLSDALAGRLDMIRGAAADSALGELLATVARPGLAALEQARAVIEVDAKLLGTVQTTLAAGDAPGALEAIRALQDSWANPEIGPGLARAAELLARVLQSLMRGQLASLFDFNAVREEIERRLLDLLPTRIHQTYDFDTRLEDYPAGDPVFQINRGASPDELPLSKAKNDLVLETSVEVDLVKKTRRATLKGTIRPFDIRLLGNRFDLATVKFKGAEFTASTYGKPEYKADLLSVEIGSMLEFIKELQKYFSPKQGNGPYLGISLFPPEAVAGYRYTAPVIPVGTLFFMNIAVDISMHLPFDNRQAYFRFAFASRELPFLISAPPYGGGGFVALLANAKGIIGFEIQFEFGAVVPIEFGPLSAQGRVTAGIYLMSGVDTRVLEGFVCAVGEGNIACFGVSVSIVVRVRQQESGAMQGSSTYSMSFKVGIVSVSYSFSAQYTIQGGDGNRSRSSNDRQLQGRTGAMARSTPFTRTASGAPERGYGDQWITTRVPPKQSKWKDYRAHVALSGEAENDRCRG